MGTIITSRIAYDILTDSTDYFYRKGARTLSKMVSAIPTNGSLSWYIVERTHFTQDAEEFKNILMLHEEENYYAENLVPVAQEVVHDIEAMLGYLTYFAENLDVAAVQTKKATERHMNNLELLTNDLVAAINNNAPAAMIMTKFGIVKTEIFTTAQFIEARI